MNKKTYISLILLFLSSGLICQVDSNKIARNIVSLDIFGHGGYGSINYERLFYIKEKISISSKIGFSSYNLLDYTGNFKPDYIIPFSINALYGTKHKINIGIGQTITSIIKNNYNDIKNERKNSIHAAFLIGYRYQKKKAGLVFGIFYSPVIEYYKELRQWGGISIGYNFGN